MLNVKAGFNLLMLDQLLDLSIFFSFDRSGYLRHQKNFAKDTFREGNSLKALITGGSAGIGLELSRALLSLNVALHISSRNAAKALSQIEVLKEEFAQATV